MGRVIKGQEIKVRSRYEEDVLTNNHTAVWGSYWRDGMWGYACCQQHVKNSYCTGGWRGLARQGEGGRGAAEKGLELLPAARQELVLHRWVAEFGRGGEEGVERQRKAWSCCQQSAQNLYCTGEGWGRDGGGVGKAWGSRGKGVWWWLLGRNLLSAAIQAVCTAGDVRRVARARGP